MLHEFLTVNHDQLVARCRAKVAMRRSPRPSESELEHGIPLFLGQLIATLQARETKSPPGMLSTATQHGDELLKQGFTVAQVIHDYGDLCQAITELAIEVEAPISTTEFHTLNRCLDDAIASAMTEYSRQQERRLDGEGIQTANLRLGVLAHELRNLLNTATLSFEAIKRGSVAINGSTSAVHDRALSRLRHLVDRSLTEVRLSVDTNRERIDLVKFIEEVEAAATFEADSLEIHLAIGPVEGSLAVDADRQILAAVLANLLQNAFKFTRDNGHVDVSLRVRQTNDRILIDIEDRCGGLPAGAAEDLFRPFNQQGKNRSGAGLGLTICRRGVEANDGVLHVRDLPGQGCVFTVELPRMSLLTN
ncbi:MAG TPA: HAMP domain-containing sensor histidine kinase [Gammaproteobacteria bacterium]|nr:HAMP domain-containing sensor histidine kinase [Gammaproteobacteria bacterium]